MWQVVATQKTTAVGPVLFIFSEVFLRIPNRNVAKEKEQASEVAFVLLKSISQRWLMYKFMVNQISNIFN